MCGASFAPPAAASRTLQFHGKGAALLVTYVVNIALIIVTLGVYYFWARTRVRLFLYGNTSLDGERFSYHGTGKELLMGFLKLIGLFLVALIAVAGVAFFSQHVLGLAERIAGLLAAAVMFCLYASLPALAIFGGTRYRLSRTSYRGVRFALRGRFLEFLPVFARGALFTALSLGFYFPFFWTDVRGFLINHAHYGSVRASFDGRGADLFPRFVRAFFLSILTLGIYSFWYLAEQDRYYWQHTSFGAMRFRSTVTGGGILLLRLTNWLLVMLTLGIAYPWTVIRTLRYRYDNLVLDGSPDYAAIQQQMQDATAEGDALAGFLDIDVGLGL
jgi:uncharacterized membrane protein YjgN (DUF898 family)